MGRRDCATSRVSAALAPAQARALPSLPSGKSAKRPRWRTNLDYRPCWMYLTGMTFVLAQNIELQDRARLRERFFGAARTVLARL